MAVRGEMREVGHKHSIKRGGRRWKVESREWKEKAGREKVEGGKIHTHDFVVLPKRYTLCSMHSLVVGIDEVGRGPLAGPVSVGIVVARVPIAVPELADSKKMTPAARLRVYRSALSMRREGAISFGVFSSSAKSIDACGINESVRRTIARGLALLLPDPAEADVYLDGLLAAPPEYRQKTVIHGDALIPVISLASVIAKVSRDRSMSGAVDRRYPRYGFSRHKGYGTPEHIDALARFGPSAIHRLSFLSKIAYSSPHHGIAQKTSLYTKSM